MSVPLANAAPAVSEMPTDFPDWLSPILVKEVRQGLRTRLFLVTFLVSHILLFIWTFYASIKSSSHTADSSIDTLYWVLVFVGLIVMAASASGTIRNEKRNNTFELLQLTCQGSLSIVCGKWLSTMLQISIFLAGLMPYAVLRYFFNTLDLLADVFILVMAFSSMMVLVSMRVFGSCLPMWQGRAIEVFGIIMLFGLILVALDPATVVIDDKGWWMLGGVVYSVLYTLLFLFSAASNIAMSKENFATRKRLLGLMFLLLPAAAFLFDAPQTAKIVLFVSVIPALIFISFDAMLASPGSSLSQYTVFGRCGFAGRLFALAMAPSRSAGLLISILFFAAMAVLAYYSRDDVGKRQESLVFIALLAEGVLGAFALAYLTRRIGKRWSLVERFWFFFFFEGIIVIFCLIGHVITKDFEWVIVSLVSPWSMWALTCLEKYHVSEAVSYAVVVGLILVFMLVPFLIKGGRAVWGMCKGERAPIPNV